MNLNYIDFIHPNHINIFIAAAQEFNCHILVRKTGQAALNWVGKRGYTGKRADMKAKTANQNVGRYQLAGLVCSPFVQPLAFTGERLASAQKEWSKCQHLITVPSNTMGFDDQRQPRGCHTPYLLQTNTDHKHYGCVALVDMGLLIPRYIHGDYDLYAIIPASKAFDPNALNPLTSKLGSTMRPSSMGLEAYERLFVDNKESQLSFRVATYINNRIESISPDLLGALMVNHGEQLNLGKSGQTFEPVLAILAKQENGQWLKILASQFEHEQFYRNVL
jgi:hypothetical protein